jgi:hypothetical protein
MSLREPSSMDIDQMKHALGLITAYDLGVETEDFVEFLAQLSEDDHPQATVKALSQFVWLLLHSMESHGYSKRRILSWYGCRFACAAEDIKD